MTLDLRKFFSREAIVASLQRLPSLSTPVMDLLFPESARINHPLPVVGYDDLGLPSGNVPVVRRGSASISLKGADGSIPIIEPQPVSLNSFLRAADINTFRTLDPTGQQQLIDNRINQLRSACRQTAEALAAQSITGKIQYWMQADGGLLPYEVDYGTPGSVAIGTKWDAGGIKLSNIIKDLGKIANKLRGQGYGGRVVYFCDFDVYAALSDVIGGLGNAALAQITPTGIVIGNITIQLLPASYVDLETKEAVSAIPPKSIVAVDLSAGHSFFYCALDDLDANLVAMPFFAKPITVQDPSGIKIIGESKPLPVVNVKGIVKAVVLT